MAGSISVRAGGGWQMAKPDGDWTAALFAAAGVIGAKAVDFLMGWRADRKRAAQETTIASLQAETDERRDFLADGRDLRDRLNALQEKYAVSLEERAILSGKVESLTEQVVTLKEALTTERRERLADRDAHDKERRQWDTDRNALQRRLDDLERRVPLGGGE